MPLQSARQAWSYLYAIKLRLLFGISKVFGAFSWWFIKKMSSFVLENLLFFLMESFGKERLE